MEVHCIHCIHLSHFFDPEVPPTAENGVNRVNFSRASSPAAGGQPELDSASRLRHRPPNQHPSPEKFTLIARFA